jgi:archaellum biogenesis protein FlaJ (TadC family)
MSEEIQIEAQELVAALRDHRKTVQQFQSAVAQLDAALAAVMSFMASWIERLDKIEETKAL